MTMFSRPFNGYTYAYPHKTAYRALEPRSLSQVWENENQESLFLYFHIPFCEFRCGFCNLFTHAQPEQGLSTAYLKTLRNQAEVVRDCLPSATFAQMAIGGGTPTYLNNDELSELFEIATEVMGANPHQIPVSLEASPATIDRSKLKLLKEFGVDRLSVGVQSFNHKQAHAIGRPEKPEMVRRALDELKLADFKTLNIDLIYGGQDQTIAQWIDSVRQAVGYQPQEIFLYPLYVRELTGLDRVGTIKDFTEQENQAWDQQRLVAYREARDLLLASGYQQRSLRMFERHGDNQKSAPSYRCQEDAMVGLGAGARSYTDQIHYSTKYAVNAKAVLKLIKEYTRCNKAEFQNIDYGYVLDDEDRRRRFVLLCLLNADGLSRHSYSDRFSCKENRNADVLDDLPQLLDLVVHGLASINEDKITLTSAGMEYSDAIGPWLYSSKVNQRMEAYQCQ